MFLLIAGRRHYNYTGLIRPSYRFIQGLAVIKTDKTEIYNISLIFNGIINCPHHFAGSTFAFIVQNS